MQQALERLAKTVKNYTASSVSRSLAAIELVSAFKVACRKSVTDASELQKVVENYIAAVLDHLDDGGLSEASALAELCSVYEAAHNNDPGTITHMSEYR